MKLPRFRTVALFSACLGMLLPFVLLFLARLTHSSPPVDRAMVLLWPSCILLMATEGQEHTLSAYFILGGAVAVNAVLYTLAFTAIWCVAWVLRAWRKSLRDGTTI